MDDPGGEQRRLLQLLVDRLEHAGIAYMVSGSFASSLHGAPRMTRNVDVVVDASRDQLATFEALWEPATHYMTSPYDALEHRSMFTIVEVETGWKVDLIIRKDRDYSREELSRRMLSNVSGVQAFVVTAEDSIVSKMEWSKMSGSDRQLDDVASVLAVNRSNLDWTYLTRWATELQLHRQVDALRERDVWSGPILDLATVSVPLELANVEPKAVCGDQAFVLTQSEIGRIEVGSPKPNGPLPVGHDDLDAMYIVVFDSDDGSSAGGGQPWDFPEIDVLWSEPGLGREPKEDGWVVVSRLPVNLDEVIVEHGFRRLVQRPVRRTAAFPLHADHGPRFRVVGVDDNYAEVELFDAN